MKPLSDYCKYCRWFTHIFERKESKLDFSQSDAGGILNYMVQSKWWVCPWSFCLPWTKRWSAWALEWVDVDLFFFIFVFFGCCGFESWSLHCVSLGEVSPKSQFSYLHNEHINRYLGECLSADSRTELWNSNPGLTTYKQCNLMQVIYSHHLIFQVEMILTFIS